MVFFVCLLRERDNQLNDTINVQLTLLFIIFCFSCLLGVPRRRSTETFDIIPPPSYLLSKVVVFHHFSSNIPYTLSTSYSIRWSFLYLIKFSRFFYLFVFCFVFFYSLDGSIDLFDPIRPHSTHTSSSSSSFPRDVVYRRRDVFFSFARIALINHFWLFLVSSSIT